MKPIAFYLPQFHEIPENNRWWGEGYTEWTSVKKAETICRFHKQPHIPLHNNYYNLLDKKTMQWQADISMKAGIYGFCFYHYWFMGKQLLEQPVDNYLKWTDIKQKFCLSWANESWVRTWSNVPVQGNVWNDSKDFGEVKNKQPVYLMKQEYGTREDWKKHFEYLLPFFKDERYIQVDGKPVFIIYRPAQIICIRPMLNYWKELAKNAGMKGIYFIGTNDSIGKENNIVDASLMYEPAYTLRYDKPLYYKKRDALIERMKRLMNGYRKIKIYDYSVFAKKIVNRKVHSKKKCYRGLFAEYDDTPRRGKNGAVFKDVSPRKFEKALSCINEIVDDDDFVFLTAWNEWGEGAYLEPDERWGYGYLKTIRKVCRN